MLIPLFLESRRNTFGQWNLWFSEKFPQWISFWLQMRPGPQKPMLHFLRLKFNIIVVNTKTIDFVFSLFLDAKNSRSFRGKLFSKRNYRKNLLTYLTKDFGYSSTYTLIRDIYHFDMNMSSEHRSLSFSTVYLLLNTEK